MNGIDMDGRKEKMTMVKSLFPSLDIVEFADILADDYDPIDPYRRPFSTHVLLCPLKSRSFDSHEKRMQRQLNLSIKKASFINFISDRSFVSF